VAALNLWAIAEGYRHKYVMLKRCYIIFLTIFISLNGSGQVIYPYPASSVSLTIQDSIVSMSYMDIKPVKPNGKSIVLLHGKNFNGYYWKNIIPALTDKGFRVIVPDQVGWGRSSKPVITYSFHLLAKNTASLLDSLHIDKIILVGHSMGGMLAARFTMQYPQRVEKLILENPIGLEDYKRFVPYQPVEKLVEKEISATYESYKKYQQTYYPNWKPEYEQYVAAQAEQLSDPNFNTIAKVNALTYQVIYEQPVCYEWDRITVPTLLIIGQSDRTIVGKDLLTDEQKKQYGQYPQLGRKTKEQIKGAKLVELEGAGHIPHIQEPALFQKHLFEFIQ
jgi:pimeloyl-ACP methyl ester carboxylesterase